MVTQTSAFNLDGEYYMDGECERKCLFVVNDYENINIVYQNHLQTQTINSQQQKQQQKHFLFFIHPLRIATRNSFDYFSKRQEITWTLRK